MKKAFLDGLKGMSLKTAQQICLSEGFDVYIMEDGLPLGMAAVPDLIVLWHKHDVITEAFAGDPCQIEN
jgi:hypothetical protein